jgi:hypothetical protein
VSGIIEVIVIRVVALGFASLGAIVPQWSEADFLKFFRTGVDPNGRAIDPDTYLHGLT